MELDNLRNNPMSEIKRGNCYYTFDDRIFGERRGGAVDLSDHTSLFHRKLHKITYMPNEDGMDYYFPYIFNGVGSVTVPKNVAPGTIVITDLMNGCALDVRYDNLNDAYVFNHDNNGRFIGQINGTLICRITAATYYNDIELEKRAYELIKQKPFRGGATPCVQFICVKTGSAWIVLGFGIYLLDREVVGTFTPYDLTQGPHFETNYYGVFNADSMRIFK